MINSAAFDAADLADRIEAYFNNIEEENQTPKKTPSKQKNEDTANNQTTLSWPGPVTLSGLAYYLGFDGKEAFIDYEQNGAYARLLRRARLRIETAYEKKLHSQSSSGAIFALKSWGWHEKADEKAVDMVFKTLKVEVVETGTLIAASEKDVDT